MDVASFGRPHSPVPNLLLSQSWNSGHNILDKVPSFGTIKRMKRKHRKTLELIFSRPISGSIKWNDIEAMFVALGAEVSQREGSRVAVYLFDEVRVFHRPHPTPDTDKGAVASIRKWLEIHGVTP